MFWGWHEGAVGRTTRGGKARRQSPSPETSNQPPQTKERVVTSKYPNHLWMTDLTTVPIGSGFWVTWLPFSLLQCWPFCWWIGVVIDHYSRRIMGVTLFWKEPTSQAVRAFLGRVMHAAKAKPRHLVTDKGPQFCNKDFKPWCRRKHIKPRFGAIGQHGSIAVVERLILTLKQCIAWLLLVPLRREAFRRELLEMAAWYNTERPHMSLNGQTPDEVYRARFPANRKPRFEPRPKWPRGSPCATPWALVKGKPGVRIELDVEFQAGRRHLPIVRVQARRRGPIPLQCRSRRLRSARIARTSLRQPRSYSRLSKICTGVTVIICPIVGFTLICHRSYPPLRGD